MGETAGRRGVRLASSGGRQKGGRRGGPAKEFAGVGRGAGGAGERRMMRWLAGSREAAGGRGGGSTLWGNGFFPAALLATMPLTRFS